MGAAHPDAIHCPQVPRANSLPCKGLRVVKFQTVAIVQRGSRAAYTAQSGCRVFSADHVPRWRRGGWAASFAVFARTGYPAPSFAMSNDWNFYSGVRSRGRGKGIGIGLHVVWHSRLGEIPSKPVTFE